MVFKTEKYISFIFRIYFVYFSDLKTIYIITIILITMNSQHSYKHFGAGVYWTPGLPDGVHGNRPC